MRTIELIKAHNLRANKSLGQNFLTDSHVLNKIIETACITPYDTVLEIGPGFGVLTKALLAKALFVCAVEIDKRLCDILKSELSVYKNIEIICADILKTDVLPIIGKRFKIVSNLPYNIASAVIMKFISGGYDLESMTVMTQKEVGLRFRALPGCKDYGALSVMASYYADITLAANVPRNCFYPRPNVDSCVLTILPKAPPAFSAGECLFKTIKAAFANRRKTLLNCLAAEYRHIPKDILQDIIISCGHDKDIRGEELGLHEFEALSDAILKYFL